MALSILGSIANLFTLITIIRDLLIIKFCKLTKANLEKKLNLQKVVADSEKKQRPFGDRLAFEPLDSNTASIRRAGPS